MTEPYLIANDALFNNNKFLRIHCQYKYNIHCLGSIPYNLLKKGFFFIGLFLLINYHYIICSTIALIYLL